MSGQTVRLQAVSTIAEAEALHGELLTALGSGEELIIDASDVTRIDASVLQLIYATMKSAGDRGGMCTWIGVTDELHATAELCCLSDLLGVEPPGAGEDVV